MLLLFRSFLWMTLLTAIHQDVFPQEVIRSGDVRVEIPFLPYSDQRFEPGNRILIQLAAARDVNPFTLKTGIRFTEEVILARPPDARPELILRIREIRPDGDVLYRGFSVSETLIPSSLNSTMSLVELPDSTVLRTYRLEGLTPDQLLKGYISSEIPVVEDERMAIVFSEYQPLYDSLCLQNFQHRIRLINDYFAASALLDTLLAESEGYNPLDESDIPEKYIRLVEFNKVVALLEQKQFAERLNLHIHDPEHLRSKLQNLIRFTRSASMTLSQQIRQARVSPLNSHTGFQATLYMNRLMAYVNSSLLMNSIRGDIYREYLDNWFVLSAFPDDRQFFIDLLDGLFPQEETNKAAQAVSSEVWQAYTRKADELISESRFSEAVVLLRHADRFRKFNPWMPAVVDSMALMQLAVKGIFLSYLGIAGNCIDQGNFPMAQAYLDKADTYKREVGGEIQADTLISRIFRKLFSHQLTACDELLAERRFHEAIACYRQVAFDVSGDAAMFLSDHLQDQQIKAYKGLYYIEEEQVYSQMKIRNSDIALVSYGRACEAAHLAGEDPEVSRSLERLASLMLPVLYQELIDRGTTQYYTYKLEEAYQTFSQAKEIAEQAGIPSDSLVEEMYRESYRHHMLNEISIATSMIWNDELDQARQYVQQVRSVMDLYNLEPDQELQHALENYSRKIDRKVCLDLHRAMEALMARAQRNIEMKQFDVAVKQLGEARQLALSNPACSLSSLDVTDLLSAYLPAAFYQEKLQEANRLIALGSVMEALDKVADNERFYLNQKLERYQVPYQSLLEFILESQRISVYEGGMSLFIRQKRWDDAWVCLVRMFKAGVDEKQVRGYQDELGRGLALRDMIGKSVRQPEEMVKGYTAGNRWFAKFAQAYLAQWKFSAPSEHQ